MRKFIIGILLLLTLACENDQNEQNDHNHISTTNEKRELAIRIIGDCDTLLNPDYHFIPKSLKNSITRFKPELKIGDTNVNYSDFWVDNEMNNASYEYGRMCSNKAVILLKVGGRGTHYEVFVIENQDSIAYFFTTDKQMNNNDDIVNEFIISYDLRPFDGKPY